MTRWETMCIALTGHSDIDGSSAKTIKQLGLEGWELVTVLLVNATLFHYFKRPLLWAPGD